MHILNGQEARVAQGRTRFDGRSAMRCAALLLLSLVATASGQAIGADSCFAVGGLTVRGDVFREALLNKTATLMASELPGNWPIIKPTTPPPGATRCSGESTAAPQAAPSNANYFGNVASKQGFRNVVNQTCGVGARYEDQYFSMGHAIYYRNCHSGDNVNYIYFWGVDNGNKSSCFGGAYPQMYQAFLTASKGVAPTADDMASTFSGSGFAGNDAKAYALGNMMAAILISESTRDYFVIPANYMLIDLLRLAPADYSSARIIGGHCVPSASTCQNTAAKQDGAHPLAWGGAQATMMLNQFSGAAGANSDFGMAFERALVIRWLLEKKLATPATGCNLTRPYSQYQPAEQTALTNLFLPLFDIKNR